MPLAPSDPRPRRIVVWNRQSRGSNPLWTCVGRCPAGAGRDHKPASVRRASRLGFFAWVSRNTPMRRVNGVAPLPSTHVPQVHEQLHRVRAVGWTSAANQHGDPLATRDVLPREASQALVTGGFASPFCDRLCVGTQVADRAQQPLLGHPRRPAALLSSAAYRDSMDGLAFTKTVIMGGPAPGTVFLAGEQTLNCLGSGRTWITHGDTGRGQ
jgi:hypothetical protein